MEALLGRHFLFVNAMFNAVSIVQGFHVTTLSRRRARLTCCNCLPDSVPLCSDCFSGAQLTDLDRTSVKGDGS
jgi:hypothetical protein